MKCTTLYVTVPDGEIKFEVPADWLEKQVSEYDMTLDEFMNEYTSDESSEIYARAILDGLIF